MTAFQPFFADLDPPKFLTDGDEIYLPSQVRNYTEKKQKVDVTMAKADWFTFLGPEKQHIDVEPGNSSNSIFGFKTMAPVKDGKQRVTAIADTDSDAIEKPVTVRPNGQEIVQTIRVSFRGTQFDVNFPANTLPKTQKAELKIYPNLLSCCRIGRGIAATAIRLRRANDLVDISESDDPEVCDGLQTLHRKAKKYLQKAMRD